MSKKMKGIDIRRSLPLYEDDKARLKYQTLLQDYQDLQKEVVDMRNRLDSSKGRKKRLSVEVRFLRRRYMYLLETKSSNQQRQEQSLDTRHQSKLAAGGVKSHRKQAAQFKLPPLPDLKHKGRVYAGKEGALRNTTSVQNLASSSVKEASRFTPSSGSDNNYKRRLSSGKDATTVPINEPAIYLSQNENMPGGTANGLKGRIPIFDLNQDTSFVRKEAKLPNQAPKFDLNEISMDEEV